jgi:hypothetical protein
MMSEKVGRFEFVMEMKMVLASRAEAAAMYRPQNLPSHRWHLLLFVMVAVADESVVQGQGRYCLLNRRRN